MTRTNAVERAHRILSILPWIMANPGCGVTEVAERFAIDEKSLREDLDVVFNRVEVYPFTPDMLIDVMIEDDQIFISLGDYFDHPPGLNANEALTMLTAAELAMGLSELAATVTDGGLLASATEKLRASIGHSDDRVVAIEVADAEPEIIDTIREAITTSTSLRISYYSYGRDTLSERTIDPWRLTNHNGYWYLKAFCHQAGSEREFRLDRIYSAESTDISFQHVPDASDAAPRIGQSGRPVTLVGPASIDWVSRTYPVESTRTTTDGRLEIKLVASHDHWLERLLLRLPTEVEATDDSTGSDLGWMRNDAARRVLDRYGFT